MVLPSKSILKPVSWAWQSEVDFTYSRSELPELFEINNVQSTVQ